MFRKKMSSKKSKRDFKRKASPHKKNLVQPQLMRGGYRL